MADTEQMNGFASGLIRLKAGKRKPGQHSTWDSEEYRVTVTHLFGTRPAAPMPFGVTSAELPFLPESDPAITGSAPSSGRTHQVRASVRVLILSYCRAFVNTQF